MARSKVNGVVIETVDFCGCTNTQLERGETCGQAKCPNSRRHARLLSDGSACSAVPTTAAGVDRRALRLLAGHPSFDRDAVAWVGSEHLGGGVLCASVYTNFIADAPYLLITEGMEGEGQFLLCVYVDGPDGEEAEDPFLVSECGPEEMVTEALRMLESAKTF